MQYNFDEIVERKGTHCVKHDGMEPFFGRNDLLPMWVADMDFRSPDFVVEALKARCGHEVFGYPVAHEGYWDAVINWLKNHYSIDAKREELHFIPGIVAGISFVLQAMSQPGDGILVTTPVYPPFLSLPRYGKRQLNCSPLRVVKGRFEIDFDDFEQRAKESRWLILSNPHNPGGTLWGKETLCRVAEICGRYGVRVISDEIHADMALAGRRHVSFSTVSQQAADISITFMAPSKTFNIAGLSSSVCYCPNKETRDAFFGYLDGYGVANGDIFAYVGAEAAFREGEEWLRQMLEYLQGNVEFLQQFLSERLPRVRAVLPEASYLAWLDFGDMGCSHEQLRDRLANEAHVALNDGTSFGGEDYRNCFRINLGCTRAVLREALERIAALFK